MNEKHDDCQVGCSAFHERAAPESVNEQQMFAQQGQHVWPFFYTIYWHTADRSFVILYGIKMWN